MSTHDTITFCSDYGWGNEKVGIVKSLLRQLAPDARVVDLTHGVAAFDVRGGSLVLARSVQYLAAGVVLAIVDPGAGTDRKAIAVEVGKGAGVLVGPDNGLLGSAVAIAGGATDAVHLIDIELPAAAAYICAGVPLAELGDVVDPAGLLPSMVPVPRIEDGSVVSEVLWVDHYGNVQLNVDTELLDATNGPVRATFGNETHAIDLVVDPYGLLSVRGGRELGLVVGNEVTFAA